MEERGLDFEQAVHLFAGLHYSDVDDRFDYGEKRWISVGLMNGHVVVVVWTERDGSRRVISMRKAHGDERRAYQQFLERSG